MRISLIVLSTLSMLIVLLLAGCIRERETTVIEKNPPDVQVNPPDSDTNVEIEVPPPPPADSDEGGGTKSAPGGTTPAPKGVSPGSGAMARPRGVTDSGSSIVWDGLDTAGLHV